MIQKDDTANKFHAGELTVQKRLGYADSMHDIGQQMIRDFMPDQHREFFANLPFIILGLLDEQGRPWVIPAIGQPGFISSPNNKALYIDHIPAFAQALQLDTSVNSKVGVVGVELPTRRRNRMNGTIQQPANQGLTIAVEQSFGNCPQYIQQRSVTLAETPSINKLVKTLQTSKQFSTAAKQLIETADTFFIASRTQELNDNTNTGLDASHRGGQPGFVKVKDDGTLIFPDFSGNRFYNTLGNIEDDGRVGLFFPQFDRGDAVFVTGTAKVIWGETGGLIGAERLIEIYPDEIIYAESALAITGKLTELSPILQGMNTWNDIESQPPEAYRRFTVSDKKIESAAVTSFYLQAADNSPLANYIPGQFLPIKLNDPNNQQTILRSYTISQAPNRKNYRLSIKREAKGLASQLLHDNIQVNDIIEVGKPAGNFTLQDNDHSIVMLSAGVGITPMLAMLEGLVASINNGATPKPVWFIHASTNSQTHSFNSRLQALAKQYDWLHYHISYSQPLPEDTIGISHQHEGRLHINLLKSLLPFDAYSFYLCGPKGFMQNLYKGLRNIGIDKSHIYYEFFGAGHFDNDEDKQSTFTAPEHALVRFTQSKINSDWTPNNGTLLELAEQQKLKPLSNCRSGNCGTCETKLLAGKVHYPQKPHFTPSDGYVLTCCALPADEEGVELAL